MRPLEVVVVGPGLEVGVSLIGVDPVFGVGLSAETQPIVTPLNETYKVGHRAKRDPSSPTQK